MILLMLKSKSKSSVGKALSLSDNRPPAKPILRASHPGRTVYHSHNPMNSARARRASFSPEKLRLGVRALGRNPLLPCPLS